MVVAEGVIYGRLTYGNTLKYIVMAVSSNFGNVSSLLVASVWLPYLPMLPIHILVQNLLYDISQIAIPWDNMDPEFLMVSHRWSMKSVLYFMLFMGPWSSIFDMTTFTYMWFYYNIKTNDDQYKVRLFQTTWFIEGLLTQTLIVHMIRTPKIPFIQSRASNSLIAMTLIIVSIGLALPYIPLINESVYMVHLHPMCYPYIFAAILSYCIVVQFAKLIYIKIFGEWF
jgi:Mg2+-importing ATPase